MAVYVLDQHQRPLMPCSEKRAQKLLSSGRARGDRMRPFALLLIDRTVDVSVLQPVRLKIDPGSKATGIALARGDENRQWVLALIELKHCGNQIRDALTQGWAFRRRRRGHSRHRPARFDNRPRPEGWLASSLQHRVHTVISWAKRLLALAPGTRIDLVRLDMPVMQTPDIAGVQYQQGILAGYEVRASLLEKWGRPCIDCDAVNVPLQIEHLRPKADGGSNRPSTLEIACEPCNQKKGSRPLADFVRDPRRLSRIPGEPSCAPRAPEASGQAISPLLLFRAARKPAGMSVGSRSAQAAPSTSRRLTASCKASPADTAVCPNGQTAMDTSQQTKGGIPPRS